MSLQNGERIRLATGCFASIERAAEAVLITLAGEFDLSCEEGFHAELDRVSAWRPSAVIVDLHEVTFIDSRALSMLLSLDRASRQEGFALTLVRAQGQVQRALTITGLDRLLPLDRTLQAAATEPAR